jgi:2-polyprenyl-3-methyl-5-hydroxy-6-metoxy-1,4-benzoquinol methylase
LECIAADEHSQSKEVKRFNEIENLKDYTLLISSDNEEIYEEIRDKAGNFKGEIVDLADVHAIDGFDFRCPENKIEEVNRIQLQELFSRTEKSWKALGDEKPFWSVLTSDEYKQENINDAAVNKFYLSGLINAVELKKTIQRNHISGDLKSLDILEIGCGCGRVTKYFADMFKTVYAIDISKGNLDVAHKYVNNENIKYQIIEKLSDYEELPEVDVLYSVLVLQHNCPPVIEYMLSVLMKKIRSGGMLMFQVPTYYEEYEFLYDEYANKPEGMDMHVLPQSKIFKLAYENSMLPLEVYPYEYTGRDDNSTMFVFRKN